MTAVENADGLRQRPGDQPLPTPNDSPDVQSMVIEDLQAYHDVGRAQRLSTDVAARRELGIQRYGTALQPFNGRDVLRDLYEECIDGLQYAKQADLEGYDLVDVYVSMRHMAFIVLGAIERRDACRG